jgi:outer membrane biosynthesis protein TonB
MARIDVRFMPKSVFIIALGLSLVYGIFVVGWGPAPWNGAATKDTAWRLELSGARGTPTTDYVKYVLEKIGSTAKSSSVPVGMTGNVKMTIAVRKDGVFDSVEINHGAGDINIDQMAIGIARRAGPFKPFSDFGIRDTEVIYVTAYFRFARGECTGSAN